MSDVLEHADIVKREGISLQKGMNFRPKNINYSILLMSIRPGSPYNDGFDKAGKILTYEGENISRREKDLPKKYDQPLFTKTGNLTNNGKFFKAAEDYKYGRKDKPELVKVYEKITNNVWADKGFFNLTDVEYKTNPTEGRKAFKFILTPIGTREAKNRYDEEFEFSRRIPTEIKRIVWERDKGKCSYPDCGSTKDLHFDHIIPWSKGGSSTDTKNIQILCSKHNLSKSDKIV